MRRSVGLRARRVKHTLRRARVLLLLVALAWALLGCDVLSFQPLRDNPNDPQATVVAPPSFDPPGGTYGTAQDVTIDCRTGGVTIRYTTDGSDPTSSFGSLYVGPVHVAGNTTLSAIAYKSGLTDSAVAQAGYRISSAKDLTTFGFVSPAVTGSIDPISHRIAVSVPNGTSVTALVATFTTTGATARVGATVQVSGTTPNDFTSPVIYTVVAADGSTQDYIVTVTVSASGDKSLTSFGFASPAVAGIVDQDGHTVTVTMPFGTAVTALVATFTTTGASVRVGTTMQVSRTTPNDFTSPLTYTVVAGDGSTQDYVVTVTVGASTDKRLLTFGFTSPAAAGTVDENAHTVAVAVPSGTNATALVAAFSTSGVRVKVGSAVQTSGTTPNDFTNPVTYTVVAADGSAQDYLVTVTLLATVSYSDNGATSGTVPVDSTAYSPGANVTVLGNTGSLARTGGYAFVGWNTAANGSGTSYSPGRIFVMGISNVSLYAIWVPPWTQRTMPSSQTWQNLFYGNGIFLAQYGSNVVATSTDGVTWTEHTLSDPPPWGWIAYGNGVYVTVSGSGVSSTSPDGLTWTQHPMPSGYGGLQFLNGIFLARTATTVATSTDGITWTEHNMPSNQAWSAIAYGNGTFVVVTNDGTSVAATSPDGATWTKRQLPGSTYWKAVTFGNGVFVALNDGSSNAATSTDGITWTTRSLGTFNYWYSVTYGGGTFVAVGLYYGVAVTSPDGVTWTQRSLPTSNQWCTVVYGSGIFVASNWETTNFVARSP